MPAAIPFAAAAFVAVGSAATAIGLGTAFMIGAMAISWGAVLTITGVALMAVSALTMKTAKPASSGGQLDTKLDPKAPVPVLYGRSATGGYAIYKETYGSKNKYAAIVAALSIGPILGINSYIANDRPLTFYGDPHVAVYNTAGYADSKLYRGKFRMRYQRGETPAPQTIDQAAGGGLPKSPGKLSGIAHAIQLLEFDSDQFPQGMPKGLWVVSGIKVYDPRKDSTFPGGSGAHRRANHQTWEFSENPYLCALDWTLGRQYNGTKVYGIGAKWEEVDVAAFVAGANIADANGWKVGGVVVSSDDKMAVLGTLLESGGGIPIARGAQISCMVNAPKVSTLTLTSADVIGEVEVQNSTSWRDRSNTVVPSYREESQLWEVIAGQAVSSSVYVEEDGGETKTIEVEYPLVQQAKQAHQLAVYELCNGREFLTMRVTAGIRMLNAKVGEAITVNLPEINANGQKCLVVSREFNPADWSVVLGLKSETDAKHPFALGQTQVAPPSPALDGYNPAEPGAPDANAWSITSTTITADDGVIIPALVVSGENDDPNTAAILVEYRPTGSAEWINWGSFAKATRQIEITAVTRNTAYDVAVSYRTVLGVTSDRLLLSGTAGDQSIDWNSGVIVGDGKPEDGATVGAPDGTYVGSQPAENVVDAITGSDGQIIRTRDISVAVNNANAAIDELVETYGSTATAAASANAAQIAASAAQASAGASQTASDNAATAKSAAEQAENDAVAAKTAAEAARSQALTAATNAGTANTNAQAAKTAAQTAKADAEAAFANSTTAKNAAVAAQGAAETARNNAQTYASNASNSATAAAGSATTASTKASEAGNSATAAQASNVSASSTYNDLLNTVYNQPLLPFSFEEGTKHWTRVRNGAPANLVTVAGTPIVDADFGQALQFSDWTSAGTNILSKGAVAVSIGRIYEVTVRFKVTASDGSVSFNTIVGTMAENYVGTDGSIAAFASGGSSSVTVTDAVQTFTAKFTIGGGTGMASLPSNTKYIRPGFRLNSSESGLTLVIGEIRLLDVTEREASAASANAASTSASAAASSATDAGTSASAAQTSATTASTKAGQASTSASSAATSETNAKASENAAKSSQTAAATSATNAVNSATAAATSASTASTKATEAGQSASTATTQANTAITKAGEASTSASNAATSESNANASKNAASTSATNAANSATAAGGSASAASGSASNAQTSATNASNSASSAAASAVSASSSFDGAKVTAASLLPSDFMQDGLFWSHTFTGVPGSQAALSNAVSFVDVANVGRVAQMGGTSTYRYIAPLGAVSIIAGRTYRLTMSVRATSATAPGVRLYGIYLSSSYGQIGQPSTLHTLSVQNQWYNVTIDVTGDAVIAGSGAYLRPLLRLEPGETHTIQLAFLKIEDVTSQLAAASSASAAATSASSAGTSATNAGNSANSATQSANTASTKANEASNSATSAASSASSASSSSTNASNSATAANSSDVSAMLSAAAQMPSDFQQEGKFWQNGFGGLPQTVSSITANSIFSFQNGGSEGRVMRVTSSSQIDVGNIGMLPLQADRLYRFTARVRQLSGPLATLQLYRIGISATGGSFGNGTVASGTMTALNEWRDFTGTIASNTVTAMIAAGAANIRTLLRLVGSSSTVVVEYSYIRIEDITESANAAGSASAAANSASQASASQSAAGSSASSAQTSATNAATSAGQASTSASNASTSANNAAGSANTASTQATNASNSANAASGSATSANNSAAAASTSASNAGNSATTSATQALYAASRATGNFVAKSLFEDGNVGSWISTVSVTSYSNGALGTTKELRAQARDSYEDIWVPLTSTNNRTLRLSGYARCGSASAYAVRVGVHGLDASNTQSWMHAPAANAGMTTWTAFNTTIVVPSNVVKIRPFLQSNNDTGMAGSVHDARIVGLTIEDVTESTAAAGSASAAAISASQASASQSAAGSSASSATNSANSAATQANNASSSASAAAGSASSASSSSSNAGSSALSASNSANTASTKAGEASSSASAAAGSASTASAAASTATTQANLAATYSTGGGNLLPESSFEVGVGNWEFYAATGGTDFMWARDLSGDSWRPTNEHNLGIRLASGATDRAAQWATPKIAVAANTWYEFSGYLAAHRCNAYLRADWYDSANAFLRSDISNVNNAAKSGGPKIDNWMRCWSKVKAPATAAYVYFIFIKDATISGNSDSYAWLCRPMLRETYEQASGPSPYAPASGRATQALQQAEINTAQTALATANASIANLNTNVSTLNSSVNVQQTAINNLNGKTAAYWQVNAVAGGRAQLTVYADSNGGGGVDIVGDLRVTGNALITGTVNPEALALSRFVKRVGPVSISATNNTGVLYSATLGETMGNGSYLLEGTVGFTYTSGRSTTTYNGRPLYTDYANDGGVNVLLKKNGNVIASTGWSGNLLGTYGSLAFGSAMTTVFDAPAVDTYTANVTVEVVAFKGSTDTGIVNQGDYYTRTISGSYTNFSFSNLRLKWTFI